MTLAPENFQQETLREFMARLLKENQERRQKADSANIEKKK